MQQAFSKNVYQFKNAAFGG